MALRGVARSCRVLRAHPMGLSDGEGGCGRGAVCARPALQHGRRWEARWGRMWATSVCLPLLRALRPGLGAGGDTESLQAGVLGTGSPRAGGTSCPSALQAPGSRLRHSPDIPQAAAPSPSSHSCPAKESLRPPRGPAPRRAHSSAARALERRAACPSPPPARARACPAQRPPARRGAGPAPPPRPGVPGRAPGSGRTMRRRGRSGGGKRRRR
jgi:hypothetical protein